MARGSQEAHPVSTAVCKCYGCSISMNDVSGLPVLNKDVLTTTRSSNSDFVSSSRQPIKMMFLAAFVAVVGFVSLSSSKPVESRAVVGASNAKTSLTLIYQNNLNASDDKNHVGALILDAIPQANAAAACDSLHEKLLPKATIQKFEADFNDALSYQDYAKYQDAERGYYIENGTVSVGDQISYSTVSSGPSRKELPVLCTQSANNSSSSAGPGNGSTIAVASGSNIFIGYRDQKSFRFLGVPYADTPQRFKYSSVYSRTSQTIQATSYGSQCAQGGSGSEDCLFLNIQTPYLPKSGSKKQLRPVLFWIHGGGFTGGSGADSLSDGGNLASKEDLVVVSINYRLSTLGFLAIPRTEIKGNFGIADQVTALDWVVANIAYFGGDPKRITIAGESAGAGSVRTLLGSPKAIGKYAGAIAMSNLGGGVTLGLSGDYGTTYSTYYTIEQSYNVAGPQIFAAMGCNDTDLSAQIACLEKIPAAELVGLSTVARYVVQDGKYVDTPNLILSTRNASTAHVPVIFGITRNDGASFSTYPKTPISNHTQGLQVALSINSTWAQRVIESNLFPLTDTGNLTLDSFNVSQRIATDKTFRCIDQATVYAGASTRAFEKAYYYQFERTIDGYDPNNLGQPANGNPKNPYFRFHGADMPWLFGTLNRIRELEDLWSVQLVSSYFGAFVRSGNPNPSLLYLDARGYDKVIEGVKKHGSWGEVDADKTGGNEIRLLDWPSKSAGFVDVKQCAWLGYPLNYYLKGGK
ncbi:acetylcholinesterase precursor [Cucurbitaria berberidis CBS 394.84]|uniref:Acetylcholinesterase n=1 Tax=Cucurbitaria berberidis CBS 394.84 TaxID=1168544 RepID=A0A9P4GH34_9PLEO|nr:acetylcholinesterase precursor [Cucurbitaria berberidis CBS 394.84]KAF1845339.1 acetylcholinesterase precursor [Cucurbitaria berberidis CBS 394.84]